MSAPGTALEGRMTFGEIEELTRYEICDETGESPDDFRVKPRQMLQYANEAEAEACLRSRLLRDSSTPEICRIALTAGVAVYAFDPRVMLILRGKVQGVKQPLVRVSHTVMDDWLQGWDDRSGVPTAFVTGMDTGKIRFDRIPAADGFLDLTVTRGPLVRMLADKDSPEIHSIFHPGLIPWIKHRIYNNQNSELFDKNRANVHLADFEQTFGPRPPAPYDVFAAMQFSEVPDICSGADYL